MERRDAPIAKAYVAPEGVEASTWFDPRPFSLQPE